MITLENEPLSDQAFLERLKDQPYVLQHTRRKGSYKLYLDGKTRVVEGLIRVVRKQLRVEEKPHPSYYWLHPALADRWERLPFEEYWSLKPGAKVYVLEDPLTLREGVFHYASPLEVSVISICEGRPTMGYYHLPESPEHESWRIWVRFHKPKV
jgi:hypothetical protein